MKKTRLLSILILAAAGLFTAPEARAQYVLKTALGGTANVAASTTNTTFATTNTTMLEVTRGLDIAIQPYFKLNGTGTSPVVLKFDTSIDNTRWTVAAQSITITANGTNEVSKVSNFTLGAVGYIRLSQIENPNASAITNLTIGYAQKQLF